MKCEEENTILIKTKGYGYGYIGEGVGMCRRHPLPKPKSLGPQMYTGFDNSINNTSGYASFSTAYNIKYCSGQCSFKYISSEFSPDGYSYYECTKCPNKMKKQHNTKIELQDK